MTSLSLRRIHLYLGLFLFPWMVTYALSTILMNHGFAGEPQYRIESQQRVTSGFSVDDSLEQIAIVILKRLGIGGSHEVRALQNETIVITRNSLWNPRRITYDRKTSVATVEIASFNAASLVARMHRRTGFGEGYFSDKVWRFLVQFVSLAVVFWVFSGFWMFFEIRSVRYPGLILAISGSLLLILFVLHFW